MLRSPVVDLLLGRDPALDSRQFEWDTACPGDQWRHSHNYLHHTHTNVLGKDRDIGYGIRCSFMIIFCGHFPEGVEEFTLFHLLSGNLSDRIEHHLFPDIPAHRGEIAVQVRDICERYGLPYNTGPLHKQVGSVVKKIVRLAMPGSGSQSPQPSEMIPEAGARAGGPRLKHALSGQRTLRNHL